MHKRSVAHHGLRRHGYQEDSGHNSLTTTENQLLDRRDDLLEIFRKVRRASVNMCAPLSTEDYQVQSSEEVSPPKWNLGHTTWFFCRFILRQHGLSLPVDESYAYLHNSYYHRAGLRNLRGRRGLMTRPTVEEVYQYRRSVDERMERLISNASVETLDEAISTGISWSTSTGSSGLTSTRKILNIWRSSTPERSAWRCT